MNRVLAYLAAITLLPLSLCIAPAEAQAQTTIPSKWEVFSSLVKNTVKDLESYVEIDCRHTRITNEHSQGKLFILAHSDSGAYPIATVRPDDDFCGGGGYKRIPVLLPATETARIGRTLVGVRLFFDSSDAFYLDRIRVVLGGKTFSRGANDGKGWCLSTDPNDGVSWRSYFNGRCQSLVDVLFEKENAGVARALEKRAPGLRGLANKARELDPKELRKLLGDGGTRFTIEEILASLNMASSLSQMAGGDVAYKSTSLSLSVSGSIGVGLAAEHAMAVPTDLRVPEKPSAFPLQGYLGYGFSAGASAGGGIGVNLSLWTDRYDELEGVLVGVSLEAGITAGLGVGMTLWMPCKPSELPGRNNQEKLVNLQRELQGMSNPFSKDACNLKLLGPLVSSHGFNENTSLIDIYTHIINQHAGVTLSLNGGVGASVAQLQFAVANKSGNVVTSQLSALDEISKLSAAYNTPRTTSFSQLVSGPIGPFPRAEHSKFRVVRTGDLVVMRGLLRGSGKGPQKIAQLPEGLRPPKNLIFGVSGHNNRMMRLDVNSGGSVYVYGGDQNYVSLSGISWTMGGSGQLRTTGVRNYGGNYLGFNSSLSSGVVFLNGLLKGSTNGIAWIATLPEGQRPRRRVITQAFLPHHGRFARVDIHPSGRVEIRGVQDSLITLSGISFPVDGGSSSTTRLESGSIGNFGGTEYGGFRAQKTGNLVVLTGLLKGTVTDRKVFAKLPSSMRPSRHLVFVTEAAGARVRIDVTSQGNVYVHGGNSNYFTLDGIAWVTE